MDSISVSEIYPSSFSANPVTYPNEIFSTGSYSNRNHDAEPHGSNTLPITNGSFSCSCEQSGNLRITLQIILLAISSLSPRKYGRVLHPTSVITSLSNLLQIIVSSFLRADITLLSLPRFYLVSPSILSFQIRQLSVKILNELVFFNREVPKSR